jgi:hypothetical protein
MVISLESLAADVNTVRRAEVGFVRPMTVRTGSPQAHAYQLFMLALCALALGGIVVQTLFRLDPEITVLLEYADNAVCAVFLIDFALSLRRAPNRWRSSTRDHGQ